MSASCSETYMAYTPVLALRNQTDAAEAKEPPEIGLTNARDEAARANTERKSRREATLP